MDPEVMYEAWAGRVFLKFVLPKSELADHEGPDEVVCMAARSAYLNAVFEESGALDYLLSFAAANSPPSLSFSVNGKGVRWHIPVGVLADLHYVQGNEPLTVHATFRSADGVIPADESAETETGRACLRVAKEYFLYRLKESTALRNGRPGAALDLSLENTNNLWKAACAGEYGMAKSFFPSLFALRHTSNRTRAIRERLNAALPAAAAAAPPAEGEAGKEVGEEGGEGRGEEGEKEGAASSSTPVASSGEGVPDGYGSPYQHEVVLIPLRIFTADTPPLLIGISPDREGGGGKTIKEAVKEACSTLARRRRISEEWETYEILLDGVPLPDDVPAEWLSLYACNPDTSLNIALRKRK